jgi:beta-lactamase regulating signal transducer with metallopeptidase domain
MLGLGAPVIALPQSLVAALPDADLDRVVLHEYGHVQRHDDWTMLAPASIETLLVWHPAIWWIGRSLRLEREVACDDCVILQTAAPRGYASSLTKVAWVALKRPALPFALRALRSRRELTGRVERLLNPMRNVAIQPIRSVLAIGALALGASPSY